MNRFVFAGALLIALIGLGGCSAGHPTRGVIAGQTLSAGVDTVEAQYYLRNYLAGDRNQPELDRRIDALDRMSASPVPDRNELKRISQQFSNDFAALYFADRLSRLPANQRLQQFYLQNLAQIRADMKKGRFSLPYAAQNYEILFVPGYLYQRHPQTGADFSRPRQALDSVGMSYRFLATDEDGPIEANAERIMRAIREAAERGRHLILVSASKSGPEVAQALTRLVTDQSRHVAAWLNLVGTMQGSLLADQGLAGEGEPMVENVDMLGVKSLSTPVSQQRYRQFRVPPDLVVVNYVGIPVTGSLSLLAWRGYLRMQAEGPNDGLSLLPDLLAPGGLSLIELGSDHFLLTKAIEEKTLALAVTLIRWVERSRTSRRLVADE